MYELMFDLETLDTKPSAVILSIGAIIWEQKDNGWTEIDSFLRILSLEDQLLAGRTIDGDTQSWWRKQSEAAKAEAFGKDRDNSCTALNDFVDFARLENHITSFWANPSTFDFPIWDDLAMTFERSVPWTYRQKYDVRTVVRKAQYSAKDHNYSHITGVPHAPLYDCRCQVDLLTAARVKLGRGSAKK